MVAASDDETIEPAEFELPTCESGLVVWCEPVGEPSPDMYFGASVARMERCLYKWPPPAFADSLDDSGPLVAVVESAAGVDCELVTDASDDGRFVWFVGDVGLLLYEF